MFPVVTSGRERLPHTTPSSTPPALLHTKAATTTCSPLLSRHNHLRPASPQIFDLLCFAAFRVPLRLLLHSTTANTWSGGTSQVTLAVNFLAIPL